tara:strand:+ start:208 stop:465 length:258 start_codon:yes stop_codon:yes gene_type:complete
MNNEQDTHYDFNLTGKLSHFSPVRLSKIYNPRSKEWLYLSEPIHPTINYEMRWERFYDDEHAFMRAVRNYTKRHEFVKMWQEPSL